MSITQDPELHSAINELEVPAPSDDFFANLESAVAAEARPHHNIRRSLYATSGAAVAAAAVAVVLIAGGNSTTQKPQNQIAQPPVTQQPETTMPKQLLASDVAARAAAAFESVQAVGGTLHAENSGGGVTTVKFGIRSNGDYFSDSDTGLHSRYQASTGIAVDYTDNGPKQTNDRFTGVVDGAVGSTMPYLSDLERIRSIVTDDNANLSDTTYEGRPAWKIEVKDPNPASTQFANFTYVVDKETALPVDVKASTPNNQDEYDVSITGLTTSPKFTDAEFSVTPKGIPFTDMPSGYVRTTIDNVASLAGYTPLQPHIPSGYTLSEVSVGKSLGFGGDGNANTVNKNVVVLTYRNGLSSFTVTTRDSISPKTKWTDPAGFEEGETVIVDKPTELTSGEFTGVTAHLLTTSDNVHIWGIGTNLVFTISGDLSASELTQLANSLN